MAKKMEDSHICARCHHPYMIKVVASPKEAIDNFLEDKEKAKKTWRKSEVIPDAPEGAHFFEWINSRANVSIFNANMYQLLCIAGGVFIGYCIGKGWV